MLCAVNVASLEHKLIIIDLKYHDYIFSVDIFCVTLANLGIFQQWFRTHHIGLDYSRSMSMLVIV